MDHILSELSTMNHPSWVALHSMAHSFIELDKTVIHVIRLVSFLWLWFSVWIITVIQIYAPTSNAEEVEVEQFYKELQDLLELTLK